MVPLRLQARRRLCDAFSIRQVFASEARIRVLYLLTCAKYHGERGNKEAESLPLPINGIEADGIVSYEHFTRSRRRGRTLFGG